MLYYPPLKTPKKSSFIGGMSFLLKDFIFKRKLIIQWKVQKKIITRIPGRIGWDLRRTISVSFCGLFVCQLIFKNNSKEKIIKNGAYPSSIQTMYYVRWGKKKRDELLFSLTFFSWNIHKYTHFDKITATKGSRPKKTYILSGYVRYGGGGKNLVRQDVLKRKNYKDIFRTFLCCVC